MNTYPQRPYRASIRIVALAAAISCISTLSAVGQTDQSSDAQWLAVIHGRMEAVADGQIVIDAFPNIIAFTDRPQRDVALVDLEDFVEAAWGEDGFFVDDPPNAALASAIRDDLDTAIIEMTDVSLDQTLMTVSLISLGGDMPDEGDQIVLFVDAADLTELLNAR